MAAMKWNTVVVSLVLLLINSCREIQGRARRNPVCNEDEHNAMKEEFNVCIDKYTDEHHEATGKATNPEEFQMYTCKLLSDTVECGELWKRCNGQGEVQNLIDTYIVARISQFRDNEDGVDVFKCDVVKEYFDSGRADKVDETTEGSCTLMEISEVQNEFQACSHNESLSVWNEVKRLRESNDIRDEIVREDGEAVGASSGQRDGEIRAILCGALTHMATNCSVSISRCFSHDDARQMKVQHVGQMKEYYASLYKAIDLSGCPGLEFEPDDQGESYPDESYDESYDDYYEDDYYEEYSTTKPSLAHSTTTTTTHTTTTTTTTTTTGTTTQLKLQTGESGGGGRASQVSLLSSHEPAIQPQMMPSSSARRSFDSRLFVVATVPFFAASLTHG